MAMSDGHERLPEPGDVLAGKYQVERVLGRGGMGVVVKATHLQLDEPVAIKLLLPEARGDAPTVSRFLREAKAAVKIKSEHVARVLDVGTLDTGAPYMVMEFLEGCDLEAELRRRGRLPPDEAVRHVLQACEALAEAHLAGIVHRDLKPGNLFLSRRADGSPVIKVLDFGISKAIRQGRIGVFEGSLTGAAVVMGSPNYMSPEQLRASRTLDTRADIWSLGVLLYEMLTGKLPFDAASPDRMLFAVLDDHPVPIRTRVPDLPRGLERAVLRCLEKSPDDRPANVSELADSLAEFGPPDAHVSVARIQRVIGTSKLHSVLVDPFAPGPGSVRPPPGSVRPPPGASPASEPPPAGPTAAPPASEPPSRLASVRPAASERPPGPASGRPGAADLPETDTQTDRASGPRGARSDDLALPTRGLPWPLLAAVGLALLIAGVLFARR
jgi:serine/threonine-protein kinase